MHARKFSLVAIAIAMMGAESSLFGQGLQLPGIGPVNRSMGGAAVAAPLDPIGAMHWNPATISGLESNQLSFGMELITPVANLSSRIPANLFGPGVPATTLQGYAESDSGWSALPSIGFIYRPEDSPMTFGLGTYGIAGYGLNHTASTTSPVNFPQTPTAMTPVPGFGRIHADVQLMQIASVVSMQVTPEWSVAFGPTVMLANLSSNPFPFATPDDANGDGFFTYPDGEGTRFHWGGGFEAGVFYQGENNWNFGASLKSKNWFETLTYRSNDESGLPRTLTLDIEYPMFLSIGTAYTGFERFLYAADVRWTDYAHTDTFGDTAAFAPDGRLIGLGWKSVWSVALGMQYLYSEVLSLRAGYSFAESPITDVTAGFNVGAPVVLRHSVNTGATYKFSDTLDVHLTYQHTIPSSVTGVLQSPDLGAVAGTRVHYSIANHAISFGMTTHF
jgi:long-chain fatty acid transport protein